MIIANRLLIGFKSLHSYGTRPNWQRTINSSQIVNFRTGTKFSSQLTPIKHNINGSNSADRPNLFKPFLFAFTFTGCTFIGVSIWEYENKKTNHRSSMQWFRNNFYQQRTIANSKIQEIKLWWQNLPQSDRTFIPIFVLNCLVFGMWRIPRIAPQMIQYFASNPVSVKACSPMFFSMFSHYSLWHLCANMFVLHSFMRPAVDTLGQEQFLMAYLGGGMLSSLTSYIYKTATVSFGHSLGASGAIMAILAFVCMQYPNTELNIIFLPGLGFSADTAIKCLIGLDVAGCVLRWRFFDHAAHLGGAMFGIAWYFVGNEIWSKRHDIQKCWAQLRATD